MCTKKAGSSPAAFLKLKCPRCRRGNMFPYSMFNLRKFQLAHTSCEVCGVNFEPETGFYWGAMYISYAISVAVSVTLSVAIRVLFGKNLDINVYIVAIIAVLVLGAPASFRYSRAIMLHFVSGIKYDPHLFKENTDK
jgi:uncharacterized protein (DUF983 family)